MREYTAEQEGIDIERYQESKTQLTCVSCDESFQEDGETEYHHICEDIWCHQCVIDADLIGHTYG